MAIKLLIKIRFSVNTGISRCATEEFNFRKPKNKNGKISVFKMNDIDDINSKAYRQEMIKNIKSK